MRMNIQNPYCQHFFQSEDTKKRAQRYTEKWMHLINSAEKRKYHTAFLEVKK